MSIVAIIIAGFVFITLYAMVLTMWIIAVKKEKHKPNGLWDTTVPFPFEFDTPNHETFVIVNQFWGRIIHFLANKLTPPHATMRGAMKLTAELLGKLTDEDSVHCSEVNEIYKRLHKADEYMRLVFKYWSQPQ